MALAAHDQMVEQTNVDQRQRFGDFGGDIAVRIARLAVAGRMIVAEYHGSSVAVERLFDDFPGVDGSPVDRPAKQRLMRDHSMARVQKQTAEDLVPQVREARAKAACRIARVAEAPAPVQRTFHAPPAEFQRGFEACDSGIANAFGLDRPGFFGQTVQAAARLYKPGRKLKSVPALDTAADQYGQNLRVGQLPGAESLQTQAYMRQGLGRHRRHTVPSLVPTALDSRLADARRVSGYLTQKRSG